MMLGITELTYTAMISFLIVIILGPIFIPMLTKFKFGQTVRDDGPKTHLQKNGTPTMGGVLIIIAILITGLTRSNISSDMVIGLICVVGFGFVGFVDDFIIIKMKRSLGLKPWQKIVMQVALALYVSYYQYSSSPSATQLIIPFTDAVINLGPLYVPIMTFMIVGIVNAVNLTDGLDGLASGVTLIVAAFFMIFATSISNTDVAVLAAATVGACIGFLGFNAYPAKIFMGDTGSMALGGAVTAFAVLTNSMLLFVLVGGIYFAEAISVMLQVTYYKLTKKRIFKMAPIHHHFEQCGWPETKVVFTFWIVTVVLAWIGIIAVF
ncbi:phospho-N-acetylmuramoyl-pentapeptide-transferase [Romboutsia ilealis]|uniref:Phospho-N-acetylmuramoyl-pentapeptide-transferase n=1 Tax=Romboutsia faecis TaxID=2764597 RepID=A0ABR7JLZ3_9FIRM|nr:phospho-N-acetylmuramoyl-pentapeptide-transferase [Romboutsia faecis]MBC5995949.1 phospho-N-acetylmuramoyl-pentapeptide-transferase [Romboutsia faecis]MDU4934689.1 phospho-N-acetylmuramoyl-pentapeptide-transferase [Peptostreptococcaceae bacterium]MRN23149.1 phospho-N-acetylmuramoyl-pentapeptide-transferase [Romboutsia ilealis]